MFVFLLQGIQIGPLQNISINLNAMTIDEISEPDGDNNILDNGVDDSEDDSISIADSFDFSVQEEPPEYSFSEMYGHNENKEELTYDPPASNTRRRKKAK